MILLNHNIQDLQGFNVTTKELLSLFSGLRLGQVIRGKVISVLSTGEILAMLNGQKIKAHSSLNLEEGDMLFLKVLSVKPSIVLRLYGIDSSEAGDPVSKVLKMFNLEDGNLNRKIVSMLIKANLSIDKIEIQKISETLSKILLSLNEWDSSKNVDSENSKLLMLTRSTNSILSEEKLIDAMLFLRAKNIPISIQSTLIAANFLNKESEFSSTLKDFFSIINSVKNSPISFSNPGFSSEGENSLPLEQIIQGLGYDYEKQLSEFKADQGSKYFSEMTLKQFALEVLSNIKSFEGLDNPEKLKLMALRIINNIEFHQLLNSDDSGEIKNWFFQVPITVDNEESTVELKIAGNNKKSSKITKVPYKFNLSMELSMLGKIRTHGSLYQNSLTLAFYMNDEKNIEPFKEELSYLKSRMQNLGVILQNSAVELSHSEKLSDNILLYDDPNTSINIRA